MKILILCTGNSCRSQMAHGYLQSYNADMDVRSAGTEPAPEVNPNAIKVMKEEGIDISGHQPVQLDYYLIEPWNYVITVCDSAKEKCPVFPGSVDHRLHISFADPAEATGTEEEILTEFRRIRDQIKQEFTRLYQDMISKEL